MSEPYSRKKIVDDLTGKPLSRQRKYQLRRVAEGRCRICGEPAEGPQLCTTHRIQMALAQLKYRGVPTVPRRGKWLVEAGVRPGRQEE